MEKLMVVKFLIQEIEQEQELFKKHEEDSKQAYVSHWGRYPNKTRIKDNCKKIRQIMQDISKEELNDYS